MEDCSCCCSSYNESSRKQVTCSKCDYSACRECVSKYIVSTPEDATCMSCKAHFDRQFLSSVMTKSFMSKTYRNHREAILFDQERSQLPTVVPYMESYKRKKEFAEERSELAKKQKIIKDRLETLDRNLFRENRYLNHNGPDPQPILREEEEEEEEEEDSGPTGKRKEPEKPPTDYTARGHCPKEGCHGFIGQGWNCVTCSIKVCRSCLIEVPPDTPHACLESDLASVRAIRAECKACPKCRVRVFRVSGCNQMWCTECHTCFDWRTLRVITGGFFHNPHYAQWQASRGTVGGQRGNGCVDYRTLTWFMDGLILKVASDDYTGVGHGTACINTSNHKNAAITSLNKYKLTISNALLQAAHESDVNGRVDTTKRTRSVRDNRIEYLSGNIDTPTYRTKVQRGDKAYSKKQELAQIHDMYGNACRDIINEMVQTKLGEYYKADTTETPANTALGLIDLFPELGHVAQCARRIENLRNYTNKSIDSVHEWYGHKRGTNQVLQPSAFAVRRRY